MPEWSVDNLDMEHTVLHSMYHKLSILMMDITLHYVQEPFLFLTPTLDRALDSFRLIMLVAVDQRVFLYSVIT